VFRIKFPTVRTSRIFSIVKINEMAPFCNLFIDRPSCVQGCKIYRRSRPWNEYVSTLAQYTLDHALDETDIQYLCKKLFSLYTV